jgi:hypothetical protein
MSKYLPLLEFLRSHPGTTVTCTFEQIEQILHHGLPRTAHTHREWWANNEYRHPQAKAWLGAGWKVEAVKDEIVTFIRIG